MDSATVSTIWDFGENLFSGGLLMFLIKGAGTLLFSWIFLKVIRKTLSRQKGFIENKNPLIVSFTEKTITTIVYIFCIFSILSGITPFNGVGKAALGATSVFAVMLSLAAQESFSNFIAGFFIALSHPFKKGDFIVLPEKGVEGYVKEISLRHTTISTLQHTMILIPNNIMNSAIVENRESNNRVYGKFEYISVSYDSDIDLVQKVIEEVLENTEGVLDRRSEKEKKQGVPIEEVIINQFLDYSIEIRYCIRARSLKEYWKVAPVVRKNVLEAFRKNGIEIPYPVTTVIKK